MDVVDFARHLYKKLQERQDELAQALVSGVPKDWEHYRRIVGEIQGLSYASEEVRTLLERNSDYEGFDEPR